MRASREKKAKKKTNGTIKGGGKKALDGNGTQKQTEKRLQTKVPEKNRGKAGKTEMGVYTVQLSRKKKLVEWFNRTNTWTGPGDKKEW